MRSLVLALPFVLTTRACASVVPIKLVPTVVPELPVVNHEPEVVVSGPPEPAVPLSVSVPLALYAKVESVQEGPVAPVAPFVPVAPVTPLVPAGPVAPVAPSFPLAPVGPVAPSAPFAPVGPAAPAEPFAPVGPVGPDRKSTRLNSSHVALSRMP